MYIKQKFNLKLKKILKIKKKLCKNNIYDIYNPITLYL